VIEPQNPAIISTERTRNIDDGASWVAINSPYFISRTNDPQSPSVRYGGTASDGVVDGLSDGFAGVLDISSTRPSAALTVRSLRNENDDFLMTTFPITGVNQVAPAPVVYPRIADGDGYTTEFILLNPAGKPTRLFTSTTTAQSLRRF